MEDSELRRVERLEDRANQSDKEVATLTANIVALNATIMTLTTKLQDVSDSLQNMYITQTGSTTTIKTNEKIIWSIVTIIGASALYLLQNFVKTGGIF